MKKTCIIFGLMITVLFIIKCGPAAEDRFEMKKKATRLSDSISKIVDSALIIRP